MLAKHILFGMAAILFISAKVVLFYLLYQYTFQVERRARARKRLRFEMMGKIRERRNAEVETEKENLAREAVQHMYQSLRKNFSLFTLLALAINLIGYIEIP